MQTAETADQSCEFNESNEFNRQISFHQTFCTFFFANLKKYFGISIESNTLPNAHTNALWKHGYWLLKVTVKYH